ncbi:MAG: hypothetical protein RL094_66 [Candidatus Parcubacteria bacterium]|jgi:formamidopyrimidine-DNA glycosylase
MPELPEVQTTVNGIHRVAKGLTIKDVWTDYNSPFHSQKDNIKNPSFFTEFSKAVIGANIVGASRRAKNILIHLSNGKTILVHMKMTGHMMFGKYRIDTSKAKDPWSPVEADGPLADPFNRFIHFVITFSNNTQLVLSDMRKFAKVTLLDTESLSTSPDLQHIGPEPLDAQFTLNVFKERINKKPNGKIKSVLMDQTLISGIGNIYSDEVLWRAGVHPETTVSKIPEDKVKAMLKAVKETLERGIDFGGDSMSDYRNIDGERGKFQDHHEAYRRTGKECRKRGCGGKIVRKVVGGRSAHFCDTHQEK